MAAKDAHLLDLICHCPTAPEGHPLNTPGCQSTVKAGTYGTFSRRSHPSQTYAGQSTLVLEIYSALAKAASTSAERKRWRDHRRMLDEGHKALRNRPEPCMHCSPLRCSCRRPAGKAA